MDQAGNRPSDRPPGPAAAPAAPPPDYARPQARETGGARPHVVHRHLAHLAAEYLRLRYAARYLKFIDHLRTLPRAEARTALAMLALVAVVVLAMPVLVWLGVRAPAVTFEAIDGSRATVPAAGLALTLLAFGAGWAYALVGGALGPGVLWLAVALLYTYFVLFIGLAATPTYLQYVPLLLIVVIGALTPRARWWAQYLVIALVASLIVRTPPFAVAFHAIRWQVAWLPVAGLIALVHHTLARRPWASAAARIALAAVVTCGYLAAVARLAAPGDLATGLNISLNGSFEILSLLWFVLGASFIGGGIALARLAREALEALAPARLLPWVAGAGWLALLAWVVLGPAPVQDFPLTAASVAALLVFAAALAVAARRGRVTRDWLAGWLVAALAAVLVLRAYATHGIRNIVDAGSAVETRTAALSLAGFMYAITWEVGGEIGHVPLSTPRLARPSPLLLYLAGVVLISAAALFGTSAHLADFQRYIVLNEYEGAVALSVPLALLAAVRTWPVVPAGTVARAAAAFYWGAVLAVPAFVVRAGLSAPGTLWLTPWARAVVDAAVVAAPAALSLALVARWPDIRTPRAAAAIGCGAGLGFVVGVTQPVLAGVLQDFLQITAALTKNAPLHAAAIGLQRWLNAAASGSRDDRLFAVLAVGLAIAAAGATVSLIRRSAHGHSMAPSAAEV